jgi:hypothetical protein
MGSVDLDLSVYVDHLSMDTEALFINDISQVKASVSIGTVYYDSHHSAEVQQRTRGKSNIFSHLHSKVRSLVLKFKMRFLTHLKVIKGHEVFLSQNLNVSSAINMNFLSDQMRLSLFLRSVRGHDSGHFVSGLVLIINHE